MRYPITHQTRRSLIVAVLLIAVGALATAAAHVSRTGSARGDISLADPIPDRAPAALATGGSPTVAPLFTGRPAAAQVASLSGGGVSSFVRSEAAARRFSFVPENRAGSSSYRDFAGERARNLQTRSASGGGASAGGGGVGGGGGGFGGRADSEREQGAGSAAQASRATRSSSRSGASGGGGGATVVNSGPGAAVVTLPASATPTAVVAVGTPGVGSPLGSSPGASPTPEPLTLFLVGSGLAGLYGARKHLAG